MKLKYMEQIVLDILEKSTRARGDDHILMYYVCRKLVPEVLSISYGEVLCFRATLKLPNYETVTRCRRKIQSKRPDLLPKEVENVRKAEYKQYKKYARS